MNCFKYWLSFLTQIILLSSFLLVSGCQLTERDQQRFDPDRAALARLKLGLAYLEKANESEQNLKAAHYNLSLANQYSPNNPAIMLGLARFDQHVGENKEAEQIYNQIIAIDPSNGMYRLHYAIFLCANNQYLQAKIQFEHTISLDNKQWKPDGLEQFGYCALQNKEIKEANTVFKKLFIYDKSRRQRVKNTAQIYRANGDKVMASELDRIAAMK